MWTVCSKCHTFGSRVYHLLFLLCLEDWRDVVGFLFVWLCTFVCLRRRGDKTWASMSTSTSSAVALNSGFFWAMIWMTWLRLSGGRRPKLWPKCRFSSIDIARLLYKKHQSKTKPPDSWRNTSWTETQNNLEATENMLNFRPTYLFFGVVCCFRSSNFLSSSSSCKQQVQYVSSLLHQEFVSEGKSFGGQKLKFTVPNKSQELIPDHRSFPYH